MYRDVLTDKWVIGSFSFLIVFGIACYFWYQHELAPYKQQAVEAHQQWEASQKADTKNEMAPTSQKKPVTETVFKTVKEDTDPIEIQANLARQLQETKNAKEVPVSPHGFGPYPEVPEDYFTKPFSWDFFKNDPPIFELMERVLIKLWKQGTHATGITHSNGLVYPTIRGTVYVKRYQRHNENFIEMRGHPKDDLENVRRVLEAGKVPEGIKIRDLDKVGIDPYTFLNLK